MREIVCYCSYNYCNSGDLNFKFEKEFAQSIKHYIMQILLAFILGRTLKIVSPAASGVGSTFIIIILTFQAP